MAAELEIIEVEDSDQDEIHQMMRIDEIIEPTRYYVHVQRVIESGHCMICQQVKIIKFNVSYATLHGFVCDDECFDVFTQKAGNYVIQCQITKIFVEESVKSDYKFTRKCRQCSRTDLDRGLVWETMDFCKATCLYRYQNYHFSRACRACKSKITFEQLGKFAVRCGSRILQFCSDACMQLKIDRIRTCTCCQKFLRKAKADSSQNFCDATCKNNYEFLENPAGQFAEDKPCHVCNSQNLQVVVDYNGCIFAFCSQECVTVFNFTQNCETKECKVCHKYVLGQYLEFYASYFNGAAQYVCSEQCRNISLLRSKELLCCVWCKSKKYNFDLIALNFMGVDTHICSLFCLLLFNSNIWNLLEKFRNGICHFCKRNVGSLVCFEKKFCSADCLNRFNARQRRRFKVPGKNVYVRHLDKSLDPLQMKLRNIVIVETPACASQKNVATQVEAKLRSKSTQTETRFASVETQADIPVVVKVPTPVYLERPLYKWHEPFKFPKFFTLVVPCPTPIPLTKKSAEKVLFDLAMMKPLDPLQEDMLNLAEFAEKTYKDEEEEENNEEAE